MALPSRSRNRSRCDYATFGIFRGRGVRRPVLQTRIFRLPTMATTMPHFSVVALSIDAMTPHDKGCAPPPKVS